MDAIDFSITWVDGSDPQWLEAKRRAVSETGDTGGSGGATGAANLDQYANGDNRFRDTGLLRFWFRAVERFAPWVHRIFFITCGQRPAWLDPSHPKLRLVNHSDYIPPEFLPTFQSNAIELNLHRIAELSERFVMFNDDVFLLRPVTPEYFFRRGRPVIPCDLGVPMWLGYNNIARIILNNYGILHRNFDVAAQIRRNWRKFFNPMALGPVRAAKNLASFAVNGSMIQGCFGHIALGHLKSTLAEIWQREEAVMRLTSMHKFRADDCVNQWLECAWNMCSGKFEPGNEKRMGAHFPLIGAGAEAALRAIRNQSFPQICLNDSGSAEQVAPALERAAEAFSQILPDKSSFELD